MSDPQPPVSPPLPRPQQTHRNIFVTIILFLLGGILLLPGLCSVIFGVITLGSLFWTGNTADLLSILPLWLFGMILGAGGLGLMILALRR